MSPSLPLTSACHNDHTLKFQSFFLNGFPLYTNLINLCGWQWLIAFWLICQEGVLLLSRDVLGCTVTVISNNFFDLSVCCGIDIYVIIVEKRRNSLMGLINYLWNAVCQFQAVWLQSYFILSKIYSNMAHFLPSNLITIWTASFCVLSCLEELF